MLLYDQSPSLGLGLIRVFSAPEHHHECHLREVGNVDVIYGILGLGLNVSPRPPFLPQFSPHAFIQFAFLGCGRRILIGAPICNPHFGGFLFWFRLYCLC